MSMEEYFFMLNPAKLGKTYLNEEFYGSFLYCKRLIAKCEISFFSEDENPETDASVMIF